MLEDGLDDEVVAEGDEAQRTAVQEEEKAKSERLGLF